MAASVLVFHSRSLSRRAIDSLPQTVTALKLKKKRARGGPVNCKDASHKAGTPSLMPTARAQMSATADPRVAAFRAVTSYVRPPHSHGCPPVEVVPGVWTAHYHDIDAREKLQAAAAPTTLVVNAATVDKCPVGAVSYGDGIDVLCIDGLLDDPEPLKKVEAMPQGAEKDAARSALPAFAPEECAGDAYKDFERVNAAIAKEVESGGAAMVTCYASTNPSDPTHPDPP